jgi:hypothetical protein
MFSMQGIKKYMLAALIINLTVAEVAALQALQAFSTSPFAAFFPNTTFLIAAIPFIYLLRMKNPFSFGYFVLLILLNFGIILAKSEIFYSSLDALYSLGFESIAENLNAIFNPFKPYPTPQLLSITWLFILSQLIWMAAEKAEELEKRGLKASIAFQWVYALFASFLIFLVYPFILGFGKYGHAPLFTGIAGVLCMIVAIYLLSK